MRVTKCVITTLYSIMLARLNNIIKVQYINAHWTYLEIVFNMVNLFAFNIC